MISWALCIRTIHIPVSVCGPSPTRSNHRMTAQGYSVPKYLNEKNTGRERHPVQACPPRVDQLQQKCSHNGGPPSSTQGNNVCARDACRGGHSRHWVHRTSRTRSCRHGQIHHKKDIRPKGHLLDRSHHAEAAIAENGVKYRGAGVCQVQLLSPSCSSHTYVLWLIN